MNLSYFLYRIVEYISIVLIGSGLFLLPSCQKKTESNSEDSWGRAAKISDELSYTNQDSLFQTIHDSVKDEETRHTLYKILITNETRFPNTNAYLAFLAQTEKETNDAAVIGIQRVYKGRKYYNMGKMDSSFLLMKSGINLLKQANDSLKLTESCLHLSNFYFIQGHVVLATDAALTGLKYVGQDKSHFEGMEILLKCVLLKCYAKQKNAEKGYALVNELLNNPAVKKDSTQVIRLDLYKTFGILFNELHQKDSILKAIEQCGAIYRADTSLHDEYSYAKLWQYAEVYDSAIFYLQKTYQENSDSSNLRHVQLRQFATLTLANVYLAKNELEKANTYYQMVLNNPHFKMSRLQIKGLKDSLLALNLKKGKDKTNLNLFYAAERIADTLAKEESKFIWADMSVHYETEEKEKKLKELAFAQKEFRFKVAIVFLLLMLILSLGAWRLYLNRQKRLLLLSEKQLLEAKQQLQQKELAELAIKQQLQEKEIEENKKHLQEFQANILAKNELIQTMELQMQATLNALETPEKDSEIMPKAEFSHLKILTDKDWETYQTYIDKAYPNLKNRILAKYANLTQAELRLFLLIYTGFERKEIAEILGISIDSVKKAKYRLRKKMALKEEEALESFVKVF